MGDDLEPNGLTMDLYFAPDTCALATIIVLEDAQAPYRLHRVDIDEGETVAVYDLGGGTFDVTVMEIQGRNYVALATDGDVRLGGRDWDQRLVDFIVFS